MFLPSNATVLLTTLLALITRVHATHDIWILSHNIRYAANDPDGGEKPWSVRKQLLLNELHFSTLYNPEAFICLQEVLHEQLLDILAGLGSEWTFIGVGRDDGKVDGEYSPILYRKAVWDLPAWKTVWLNEDQKCCKKGWDAGSVRIITVGTFRHRESKLEIVGASTHFDNSGIVARREGARIVLQTLDFVTKNNLSSLAEHRPFFLAGDLNSETTGEAYQILNSKDSITQDTKDLAKWMYGDSTTFTGFDDLPEDLVLIDFVFVGPRGYNKWDVESHAVLPSRFDDGVYVSDHRAVVVDWVLKV